MSWVAVAIGASALLGAGVSTSQGKKADDSAATAQEAAAAQQAAIAGRLFQQTDPTRAQLFGGGPALPGESAQRFQNLQQQILLTGNLGFEDRQDYQRMLRFLEEGGQKGIIPEFLETGRLPKALQPLTAPVRGGIEQQTQVARENILGRAGARGGQLVSELSDLEANRALQVGLFQSQMEAPIRSMLFQTGANAAMGAPATSMAGLGGAASQFGNIAQLAAAQQQAQGQAYGQTAATAGKMALKGAQNAGGKSGGTAAGTGALGGGTGFA